MRKFATLSAMTALAVVLAFSVLVITTRSTTAQSTDRIDAPQLKTMITNIGYETKDLNTESGKEKYEFKITRGGLDIPIGAELSGTKNYIWFTVYLGEKTIDGNRANDLLKQNHKVQPCFFYVTSAGRLYMGVAMENRAVTPPVVRRIVEKLVDDVVNTKTTWQQPTN
jgi:hypothetical protein